MRRFHPKDISDITALFRAAVSSTEDFYDEAERRAWASFAEDEVQFFGTLCRETTLVIEDDEGIVAFGQLYPESHINLLYSRPRGQGRGFATQILGALETIARTAGATVLTVDASLAAVGFFEKRGFKTIAVETVNRAGIGLRRHRMCKPLRANHEADEVS